MSLSLYIFFLFSFPEDREWLKVDMRRRLLDLTLNVMMRMIAGKSYFGTDRVSEEGRQFREIMREFSQLLGSAEYIGDFIPALWWADFQGVKRKMESVMKKVDGFFQQLVDEHRRKRSEESPSKRVDGTRSSRTTLIDRTLDLQEQNPELYTNKTVKSLALVSSLTLFYLPYLIYQHGATFLQTVLKLFGQRAKRFRFKINS